MYCPPSNMSFGDTQRVTAYRQDARFGVAPVVAVSLATSVVRSLKSLFGGIKGESYANVHMESLYNAALANDQTRLAAVAGGGTSDGMPYNNSDNRGGWAAGQPMSWASAEQDAKTFAQHLLQLRQTGVAFPAPSTPANRSAAQLATELGRLEQFVTAQASAGDVSAMTQPTVSTGVLNQPVRDVTQLPVTAGIGSLDPKIVIAGVVLVGMLALAKRH